MKKSVLFTIAAAFLFSTASFGQGDSKLVSSKTQITFFSTTPAEDIEAANTAAVSTIDKSSGDVVFSVPMQGFEFEKAAMQKHFNNDKFLDTKAFPDAKLKATITNIGDVDFGTDGTYDAMVEGDLTIKGETNSVSEKGTVSVKGDMVTVKSKFNVTLADYGVSFAKGKPATNVAKTVEVSVKAVYQ